MSNRYTPLFMGLLIGIATGLLYGWVIQPVESGETSPPSLQEEYRADIALMIAEIFAAEDNVEMARQRMTALGLESNAEVVTNAMNYAKAHDFSERDIEFLSNLESHLKPVESQPETKQP